MIKLQNNFTTPEQSKWLLELGLPADSADCYFTESGKIEIKNTAFDILYTPCWSVGRLIEIFETCTSTKFERWSYKGVSRPLLEDCIEHIKFALNPNTTTKFDFSKLEE